MTHLPYERSGCAGFHQRARKAPLGGVIQPAQEVSALLLPATAVTMPVTGCSTNNTTFPKYMQNKFSNSSLCMKMFFLNFYEIIGHLLSQKKFHKFCFYICNKILVTLELSFFSFYWKNNKCL